ncbi:outer membrane lipoprotein-sorting protein [Trinickia caryophylli]|uniref:Outer membrane lipoprotein-sorting protein n=1 Tax=Trinickia caryophylli TaxID=28094 RepID=A0A1X7G732_TRICW|nr:outer membrane lipoprotein-sorting protein [Trinickia caryophylli]PMS13818.1 outer membrane lipoprotein-sorting protein [Trinickia caryophylli]TRX14313.1 outer membrane lipoprotein-sorting protein [Trinickia caryophylli]WQE14144.1 outer membrane lipoprotein-sorting protein [Trinickia caryophylli]SMF64357.1 Outer membrane lipoprotein-sorting protein [Trinickia caryophylli]GLU33357.1 outer membrane lipoprotein-sorting protein [Trinickia caryophylli]
MKSGGYGPIVRLWLLFLFCSVYGHAVAQTDAARAQQLLEASDAIRNPGRPFSLTTTLTEFRGGQQTGTNTLTVYSKEDPATGQFNSLVRFDAPLRDANKLVLKNGSDLWFYDPNSQASVRISPQQRLLGQAANGDVVTVNFAKDYAATVAAEEDVLDGDHRNRHAYKLKLTARSPSVTYNAIEMWIDASTRQPVKARFYAESGTLLKTTYYRKFTQVLGADRPTETVIIDGLDPGWVTVMRYSNYAWRDIPDEWLQRAYLPHFQSN